MSELSTNEAYYKEATQTALENKTHDPLTYPKLCKMAEACGGGRNGPIWSAIFSFVGALPEDLSRTNPRNDRIIDAFYQKMGSDDFAMARTDANLVRVFFGRGAFELKRNVAKIDSLEPGYFAQEAYRPLAENIRTMQQKDQLANGMSEAQFSQHLATVKQRWEELGLDTGKAA